MTQSSLQTQCPNCQTRFRVTNEQLGIARGKVRCGNCMEVFNAVEHQIKSATTGKDSSKPAFGSSSKPRKKLPDIEEDFIFADNPEEDATEGHYAGTRLSFSEDELSDSFRSIDETGEPEFGGADDEIRPDSIDESWAEAILEDDEPPRRPEPAPAPEPEPKTAVKSEPATDPVPPAQPAPVQAKPQPQPQHHTPDTTAVAADEADDFFVPAGAEPEPDFGFDAEPEANTRPITASSPFHDLRRDPVSVNGGRGGKLRSLLWGLIILALIGILVAQVVWFQFDRLSAIPQLRPFYEQACEIAGCELAPLVDVNAVQSRKLVVRTDPANRAQLVVDAVIINRADFEQPFPAIALTFSNLNGDVVAQSIFTPDEYLAGDGINLGLMPRGTPVRIAIRIRDPGRDAVNYNLSFRPYSP